MQILVVDFAIHNPIGKPHAAVMAQVHTVFGAGQIGMQLARLLAEQGHQVRLVRRSAAGEAIPGVEWRSGDVADRAFVDEACQGAKVVYNCTNPPDYHRWEGVLAPMYRAVWQAAGRAGARLVQLDNLYMYGKPQTAPFDERTPMQPCSNKGQLRKDVAEEMLEAHARGEVEIAIGRASDFFGPGTVNGAVFRPDVYERIAKGSTVFVFGNPDMPHSYSYTPDVARGLMELGRHDEAFGRVWHLPVSAQLTTRELVDRFAARAGTSVKVRQIPGWMIRMVGKVWPLMGAIAEMLYQWDIPYLVDDGDFREAFGVEATGLDEAIDATLGLPGIAKAA